MPHKAHHASYCSGALHSSFCCSYQGLFTIRSVWEGDSLQSYEWNDRNPLCKLSGSSLSLTYFSPWRHCLGRYVHIGLWRGNEPILALGLLRTSLISLAQPSFNFYYFYWPVARPYVQLWVIYSGEWEHELVQFMKHLKIILPKLSHKYLIGTINKNKNRSSFTWLSQMQKWMSNQAVKNRR